MDPLTAFFRAIQSEPFWVRIAPWLQVGGSHGGSANRVHVPADPALREQIRTAGYVQFTPVLDAATASCLARAIHALHSNDLHPTFLYVFDEAWHVIDALRPHLSALLGDDFDVLPDVWAWHIDPRSDAGGWPVHRGWYEDVRDETGLPRLLNVWVALTDANERNACMHIVPLSRDPHYPSHLHDIAGLDRFGLPLPVPAGSALSWSANAAHWGGECDRSFDQPRLSMSFTVRGRGSPALTALDIAPLRLPLSFRERLDLIADQFEAYGDKELPPDRNEMRWAKAVAGMRAAARRRASSENENP